MCGRACVAWVGNACKRRLAFPAPVLTLLVAPFKGVFKSRRPGGWAGARWLRGYSGVLGAWPRPRFARSGRWAPAQSRFKNRAANCEHGDNGIPTLSTGSGRFASTSLASEMGPVVGLRQGPLNETKRGTKEPTSISAPEVSSFVQEMPSDPGAIY